MNQILWMNVLIGLLIGYPIAVGQAKKLTASVVPDHIICFWVEFPKAHPSRLNNKFNIELLTVGFARIKGVVIAGRIEKGATGICLIHC